METKQVIKRDGSREDISIAKIKAMTKWACDGLSVNPLELESSLNTTLKNNISTENIQSNLIYNSYRKVSITNPDWAKVAGRLFISSYRKNIALKRGIPKENPYLLFEERVKKKIQEGVYSSSFLKIYTLEEIGEYGKLIKPERDLDLDYNAAFCLCNLYLLPDELPQELFLVNALRLAMVDPPEERAKWVEIYYELLSKRLISLATPLLRNLRSPSGNLTSCFILELHDSLDDIFDVFHRIGRISKNGGGVGVYVSPVRAQGSEVAGHPNASGGVLPWIKIINDIGVTVNQVGVRAGAITVALDAWHYDLLDFLELQTLNGDQRKKSFDIFPQVCIPDLLMNRLDNNEDWYLVDPYEVKKITGFELHQLWGSEFESAYRHVEDAIARGEIKQYKVVKPKDIFKKIIKNNLETGLPYLSFKDTINRGNPNSAMGRIPCVNLCVESFSNTSKELDHCCNLSSVNLTQFCKEDLNLKEKNKLLAHICKTAVRILDNSIELTSTPNPEANTHNQLYRTIGVGMVGLADYLAFNEQSYQNTQFISDLTEQISYYCIEGSIELAKERGTFYNFPYSKWSEGISLNGLSAPQLQTIGKMPWTQLNKEILKHGIRNSHLTAIAPNTSTSILMEATPSVLPAHKRSYEITNSLGTMTVVPQFTDDKFWFYQEGVNLNPKDVVKAVASMQQWIDTGISMELLFNLNEGIYSEGYTITAKDIFEIQKMAWESGCKAIYYVRSIDNQEFNKLKGATGECEACAS